MSEQPPPNFNATASVLHVPPAAAHIRIEPVQGGGGLSSGSVTNVKYTPEELNTLKEYGLDEGGKFADKFDEPTKRAFLEQLDKCVVKGSGTQTITNSGCWAITQVLRALVNQEIQKTNSLTPMKNVTKAELTPVTPEAKKETVVDVADEVTVEPVTEDEKIVLDEEQKPEEENKTKVASINIAPKNKVSTTTGGKSSRSSSRKAHKTRKNRKVKRKTYNKRK
jgi:hypothetical protein